MNIEFFIFNWKRARHAAQLEAMLRPLGRVVVINSVYRLTITTGGATAVPTVRARDDNRVVGVFVRPQRAGEGAHRQWPP